MLQDFAGRKICSLALTYMIVCQTKIIIIFILPRTLRSKCFSDIPAMFSARQEYRDAWETSALGKCSRQPSSSTTIPSSVWLSRSCRSLNHVTSGGGTPAAGQKSVMVSFTITSGFEITSDVSIDAGTITTFYTPLTVTAIITNN